VWKSVPVSLRNKIKFSNGGFQMWVARCKDVAYGFASVSPSLDGKFTSLSQFELAVIRSWPIGEL
jgi:hypothetical protein